MTDSSQRIDTGLDKHFIPHIILFSVIAAVVIGAGLLVAAKHLPERFAWGFLFGAGCGVLNLYLLKRVIEALVTLTGQRLVDGIVSMMGLGGVVVGFLFVVKAQYFNILSLIIGFSLVLAVSTLKAVGSAFNLRKANDVPS